MPSKGNGVTKPPTLADVARLAGVSVPTASRALNGGIRGENSGSPELRERVRTAARTLGYAVSPAAQAIAGGRARSVGLVVSDIQDYGAATIIAGVMLAAERRGVSVAVHATHDDRARELELLRQLNGERHRAVVVATARTTDAVRERQFRKGLITLRDHGAAVVMVGDNSFEFSRVIVDNAAGAAQLAAALVGSGARRFAILAGPAGQVTSQSRVDGFLNGLAANGIEPKTVPVIRGEFTRDGGAGAAASLGDRAREYDVVAAMSDAMAVGAIAAFRALGIETPITVQITGYDNVPILADVVPRFSTVDVPLIKFGEAALTLALDEADTPMASVSLQPTVILHGARQV
ncbi:MULTISPECIES: LacI family DNA-binding transcriptional regulator [unclassified Curtobacterium]|uniref:LacI family DNA-binding transcriptional regulator n=1 Tax=unclassified Curtobacterium TaxID=257496 RepID=UPI003A8032CA